MPDRGDAKAEVKRAFSRRLAQLRRAAGLTQEQLALRAGVNRTYVGNLEQGVFNPTLWSMARMAAALGVPLTELVVGVPLPDPADARQVAAVDGGVAHGRARL